MSTFQPWRVRSRRRAARDVRVLTFPQYAEIVLGPGRRPAFASEAELRAAYSEDPDHFDLRAAMPGLRSWAFWHFRAPQLEADDGSPIDRTEYGVTCDLLLGLHEHGPACAVRAAAAADREARRVRLAERRLAYLAAVGELTDQELVEIRTAGGRAAEIVAGAIR